MISVTSLGGVVLHQFAALTLGFVQVSADLQPPVAGGDEVREHKGRALVILLLSYVGH